MKPKTKTLLAKLGYTPKSGDEKRFVAKHITQKVDDANGNDDKLFKGEVVKYGNRFPHHGYDTHNDDAVYEEYKVGDRVWHKGVLHQVIHIHGDSSQDPRGNKINIKGKLNIQKVNGRPSYPSTVDPSEVKKVKLNEGERWDRFKRAVHHATVDHKSDMIDHLGTAGALTAISMQAPAAAVAMMAPEAIRTGARVIKNMDKLKRDPNWKAEREAKSDVARNILKQKNKRTPLKEGKISDAIEEYQAKHGKPPLSIKELAAFVRAERMKGADTWVHAKKLKTEETIEESLKKWINGPSRRRALVDKLNDQSDRHAWQSNRYKQQAHDWLSFARDTKRSAKKINYFDPKHAETLKKADEFTSHANEKFAKSSESGRKVRKRSQLVLDLMQKKKSNYLTGKKTVEEGLYSNIKNRVTGKRYFFMKKLSRKIDDAQLKGFDSNIKSINANLRHARANILNWPQTEIDVLKKDADKKNAQADKDGNIVNNWEGRKKNPSRMAKFMSKSRFQEETVEEALGKKSAGWLGTPKSQRRAFLQGYIGGQIERKKKQIDAAVDDHKGVSDDKFQKLKDRFEQLHKRKAAVSGGSGKYGVPEDPKKPRHLKYLSKDKPLGEETVKPSTYVEHPADHMTAPPNSLARSTRREYNVKKYGEAAVKKAEAKKG